MLAFAAPTVSAPLPTARPPPIAACSAAASVGSPSAVPVPCASTHAAAAAAQPASASAARSSSRCAEPLGAVRLALRPPCRTARAAERRSRADRAALRRPHDERAHRLARTYPLARASNVLHRPSAESIPAAAAPTVACGSSLRLADATSARAHSPPRAAFAAPCSATTDDEHAVSIDAHGPWRPRANDSRPDAIDAASAVTPKTDGAADGGASACSSAQSGRSRPTKTAVAEPSSDARVSAAPCNASYPCSRSSRCCGSIAAASAADTPKKRPSKRSAPATKPP